MSASTVAPGNAKITLDMLDEPDLFTLLRERMGWAEEEIAQLDDPSYDRLQNLDELVAALKGHCDRSEKLVVLPDYDMDGITSGVLLWAGLNELGISAELFVPDHRQGHDITAETARQLLAAHPDAAAVITTDAGINSHAGVDALRATGVSRVYVTDHHVELAPGSNADIAVNPGRIEETYSNPHICGAMVAWQVLNAYAEAYRTDKRGEIGFLKLFAGIGTVSDVMPLIYENRKIVRDSVSIARLLYVNINPADLTKEYSIRDSLLMRLINAGSHSEAYRAAFAGFAVVLKGFRAEKKLRSTTDITEEFYGFFLSPAFNAIRRVDADMADAFGVFTAGRETDKDAHLARVFEANAKRKELVETHMEELQNPAAQPYADSGVYLSEAGEGMLGLLANRMMQAAGAPAIVLGRPKASDHRPGMAGSARAPGWFPVVSTLAEEGYHAVGHEGACGVRLADDQSIEVFAEKMSEMVLEKFTEARESGQLAEKRPDLLLGPDPAADSVRIDPDELLMLAKRIDVFRPFGHGFPRPAAEMVIDLSSATLEVIGAEENHLRITTFDGFRLLWWNAVEEHLQNLKDRASSSMPKVSVVRFRIRLSINRYMGEESVQGFIDELIAAPEPDDFLADLFAPEQP